MITINKLAEGQPSEITVTSIRENTFYIEIYIFQERDNVKVLQFSVCAQEKHKNISPQESERGVSFSFRLGPESNVNFIRKLCGYTVNAVKLSGRKASVGVHCLFHHRLMQRGSNTLSSHLKTLPRLNTRTWTVFHFAHQNMLSAATT